MRETATRSLAPMSAEEAETIGACALLFMVSDEARLAQLMGATGLTPQELGSRSSEPELLAAVLDYLMTAEPTVVAFAAEHRIEPERVQPAALLLSDLAAGHQRPEVARPSKRFVPLYPLRRGS